MAYQKVLVDNPICSRRFHITFDDSARFQAKVELKCPYCSVVVFSEANHPPARIARQENLIQTAELSDNLMQECTFRDTFSEKTMPKHAGS